MKPRMRRIKLERHAQRITAVALIFLPGLLVFLILCPLRSIPVQGQARSSLQVGSVSFSDGGTIPNRHTCDGEDVSPALHWSHPPAGTKSFAVVMNDPDAPVDFTHWMVYNIPPGVWGLAEGASARGAMPQGSAEGTNDFRRLGYGGPCPPPGKPHHYVFGSMPSIPASICRRERQENNWMQRSNGIFLPRVKSSESTGAQANRVEIPASDSDRSRHRLHLCLLHPPSLASVESSSGGTRRARYEAN